MRKLEEMRVTYTVQRQRVNTNRSQGNKENRGKMNGTKLRRMAFFVRRQRYAMASIISRILIFLIRFVYRGVGVNTIRLRFFPGICVRIRASVCTS